MESALNLPPVGFINVGIGPVLISLNINLLIADPARPPSASAPWLIQAWGNKMHFGIFSPSSTGFVLTKPMKRRERADAPEHIPACCQCLAS